MSAFHAYGRQPGMQVHAVPEGERAFDTAGRRLPWGYERSDRAFHPNSTSSKDASSTSSSQQNGGAAATANENAERGPFGKSTRRRRGTSRSRSKTAEMLGKRGETEEERVTAENAAREDVVFGKLARRVEGGAESGGKDDIEGGGAGAAVASGARLPASAIDDLGEPTEVLLWGFGSEMQWAAIDFYERASAGGSILEDYDRAPPGQRYVNPAANRSLSRAAIGSLSRAALRKKNQFAGGEHWIKVTFDSRQAADIACARSPHIVHGFVVSAEPWRGVGPARDEEVISAGATDSYGSPGSSSRTIVGGRDRSPSRQSSSRTVTSATVTDAGVEGDGDSTLKPLPAIFTPTRSSLGAFFSQPSQQALQPSSSTTLTNPSSASTQLQPHDQAYQQPPTLRSRGRIQGLTVTQPLPAEAALMPRKPISPASATNTLLGWILWLLTFQWIIALFGGGSGSAGSDGWIGSTVPKKEEDGTFDWDRAGWYWRTWAVVDSSLGSDFCGLRGD